MTEITADAPTRFDAHFQGLANAARRVMGEKAVMSISFLGQGKWRCVIFEHDFAPTTNMDEEIEIPPMYSATGRTPTEAFENILEKAAERDLENV